MAQLIYVGPGWIPGWPAANHDEPDPLLYEEKLASRLYRTPDGKEDAVATAEQKAAKAQANAREAKLAKQQAQEAREREAEAAHLRQAREENLTGRLARAEHDLKDAKDAQAQLTKEPS